LSRLSEECNRILSIAAVMGRDFSLDVLRAVAGVSEEQLLAAIEEAIGVSLLEEHTQGRDVRYRFTHAYFRQTLYGEMIAPRRLRIHNDVAKALEAHYATRLDEHAVELAEHFSHSSTEEDLKKAVHYGELAAHRAAGVYAHGETARLLEQALQVQEVLDPNDSANRYDLQKELSDALLFGGDAKRVSDELAPEMYTTAEKLGDDDRAAWAGWLALEALGRQDAGPVFATPAWTMWTERMYSHTQPGTGLRSAADVAAAWGHYAFRRLKEFWELAAAALDRARLTGDDDAVANVLSVFLTTGAPPELALERARVAEEFADIPLDSIRAAQRSLILNGISEAMLAVGKRAASEAADRDLEEYAGRTGDPFVRVQATFTQVTKLSREGAFEAALDTVDTVASSAAGDEPFAQGAMAMAKTYLLPPIGRIDEALAYREIWGSFLGSDTFAAYIPAMAGLLDEARRATRVLISELGITGEKDWTPTDSLLHLLSTSVMTRDVDIVRMLYKRLAPFDSLYTRNGTVARPLGLADLLLEDPAAARSHFATALDVATQVGDRPEAARIRLAIARTLFEHYADEHAAAREHLNFALSEFQAMKMQPALEEAMRLRMRDQGISAESDIYTSIVAVADSVQRERPDIAAHAAPDGTVTIMFSDIEDSTVLTERLGDRGWQDLLHKHNALIREQLQAYDGYEVKTMGDGFMVAFRSAKKGLDCAIAIQKAFDGHNAVAGEHVKVRIGLHAGEAIKDGDDFYGKNVILASRVAGKAVGGEILVSSLVRALVESSVEPGTFAEGREVELKGLAGSHTVYGVRLEA
jgi:class 3 adenylate cyclase